MIPHPRTIRHVLIYYVLCADGDVMLGLKFYSSNRLLFEIGRFDFDKNVKEVILGKNERVIGVRSKQRPNYPPAMHYNFQLMICNLSST